jgi:hypothetical protein
MVAAPPRKPRLLSATTQALYPSFVAALAMVSVSSIRARAAPEDGPGGDAGAVWRAPIVAVLLAVAAFYFFETEPSLPARRDPHRDAQVAAGAGRASCFPPPVLAG